VSISELAARLSVDPRSIKADVRELVVSFRLPIVASRDAEDGGYFFAVTAEESLSGTADYVKEIVALAERVRIIRKMPSVRALLGQMALELPELEETL
jgi:predicted DNA-binding transcriptional regulator YafY